MNLETSQQPEGLPVLESAPLAMTRLRNAMSDSARAQVIGVLMDGDALPASVIASAVQMSLQAARIHLRALEQANLVVARACGRHRYYEMATRDTAKRLESIFFGIVRSPTRPSTRVGDGPAFAKARRCYKHLAGAYAVEITDALQKGRYITHDGGRFRLEPAGQHLFAGLGIPFAKNAAGAVLTKRCIDVTHRRAHLGGPLGKSLLGWMLEKSWFRLQAGRRALHIPSQGRTGLRRFVRAIRDGKTP